MIVVLIHWKIRDDDSAQARFIQHWQEHSPVAAKGLIAEFLTRPGELTGFAPLPATAPDARNFFTFGLWESRRHFTDAIGKLFGDSHDFEHSVRTRHLFEPAHWRLGPASLPSANSPGTR